MSSDFPGRGGRAGVMALVLVCGMACGPLCGTATAQVGTPPSPPPPTEPAQEQPAPEREDKDAARQRAKEEARAAMPEAKRLLLDSASALNRARGLRYDAEFRIDGKLPMKLGTTEARVTMFKPEGQKYHWIMRATGKGALKGDAPAAPFDVAWYLDQTQFVDDASKMVVVRRGRVGEQLVRVAEGVKLKEMFGPTPWNAELEQATLAMASDDVVDGVQCRVVEVLYTLNKRTARIWLGAEDMLPRRFVRYVGVRNEQAEYSAAYVVEFRNVEVEPALTQADVTVATPAGYGAEELSIVERPSPEERQKLGARPENGAGGDKKRAPESSGTEEQARTPARPVFEAAPDFILKGADGSTVSLSSMRGSVVVLDFWGTWSIQSKQSAPELQALFEKYKDRGVRVVGLAVKERTEEKPVTTFKERGQTYTLIPKGDSAAQAYSVSTYPTIVVVGPSGELLLKIEKFVPGESIKKVEEMIEANLAGEVARPAGG